MFTVPKEKLRVVNQDVEEEKSEVGSAKGSAKGSLRSRKGSGRRSVKDLFGVGGAAGEGDARAMEPLLVDVDEKEAEKETLASGRESPKAREKGKGKVLEMVERMEGRSNPEH